LHKNQVIYGILQHVLILFNPTYFGSIRPFTIHHISIFKMIIALRNECNDSVFKLQSTCIQKNGQKWVIGTTS